MNLRKIRVISFLILSAISWNGNAMELSGLTPMEQTFLEAAVDGNLKAIEEALNRGVNVNVQDEYGITALMFAVGVGNNDLSEKLINAGADLNLQNNSGNTALMEAVERLDLGTVKLLLDHNADVNIQNKLGDTALTLVAAFAGNNRSMPIARLLISVPGANLNLKNNSQDTALFIALADAPEIAKMLINSGRVDLNATNLQKRTALMLALFDDKQDIATLLIEKNADVNKQDHSGLTALMIAVSNDDIDLIKLLISKGAKLDLMDDDGETALGLASIRAATLTDKTQVNRTIELLESEIEKIKKRILEIAKDENFTTQDREELEKLVNQIGGLKKIKTISGDTPLHRAIASQNFDLVKWLITKDSSLLEQKDNTGVTPLDELAELLLIGKSTKLAQWLIDHKFLTAEDIEQAKRNVEERIKEGVEEAIAQAKKAQEEVQK